MSETIWYTIHGLTHDISKQALAVLCYLEGEHWAGEFGEEQHVRCYTGAWYNGRERGICLTVQSGFLQPALVVAFGEVHNSDSIFVDTWQMHIGINPPTVADFSDKAYAVRKFFDYGHILEAANFIHAAIVTYIRERIREPESAE